MPLQETRVLEQSENNSEEELLHELSVHMLDSHSPVVVKGRLGANLTFWENIGASRWVLEIIRNGYCLPFLEQPNPKVFNNHSSTTNNVDFVNKEIEKLVSSGALMEMGESDLTVCSPLGVA